MLRGSVLATKSLSITVLASFRANDWNRDGALSGDEVRADGRRPEQFFRQDWRGDLRAFDRADTNRDGVLSADEFARWR
jgi:hypothetical protein